MLVEFTKSLQLRVYGRWHWSEGVTSYNEASQRENTEGHQSLVFMLKRCSCFLEKNKALWKLLMKSLKTNSDLEGSGVTCVLQYCPSLVLCLSHACTHAVNILYGMLCNYISAALQVMISFIIVIGIEADYITTLHTCAL